MTQVEIVGQHLWFMVGHLEHKTLCLCALEVSQTETQDIVDIGFS